MDKNNYDLIFKIVSNYGYTEIRYDSPDLVNELNQIDKNKEYVHLKQLHSEIEKIHKTITEKIRVNLNCPNYRNGESIYKYHSMDTQDKKDMIDDALSRGYPNYSLDRC